MSAKRIKLNTSSCPEQIPHPVSYLPSSPARMFCVLNYAPQVGWSGTAVTIDTYFFDIGLRNDAYIHIRIVIGAKPIHTKIQKIGDDRNLWRCTGLIPDFEVHKKPTRKFPVRIQAVYQRDIVDSVTVGWFTYWEEHCKHNAALILPHRSDVLRQVFLRHFSRGVAFPMARMIATRNYMLPSGLVTHLRLTKRHTTRSRRLLSNVKVPALLSKSFAGKEKPREATSKGSPSTSQQTQPISVNP